MGGRLAEVVPWGAEGAHIEGDLAVAGLERKIEVKVVGARKTALLDGNLPYGSAVSTLMLVILTAFTVVYLRLVTGRQREAW